MVRFLGFLVLACVLFGAQAQACSCRWDTSVADQLADKDFVFVAEVVEKRDVEGEAHRPHGGERQDKPASKPWIGVCGDRVERAHDDETGTPENVDDAGVTERKADEPHQEEGEERGPEPAEERTTTGQKQGARYDGSDEQGSDVSVHIWSFPRGVSPDRTQERS